MSNCCMRRPAKFHVDSAVRFWAIANIREGGRQTPPPVKRGLMWPAGVTFWGQEVKIFRQCVKVFNEQLCKIWPPFYAIQYPLNTWGGGGADNSLPGRAQVMHANSDDTTFDQRWITETCPCSVFYHLSSVEGELRPPPSPAVPNGTSYKK